MQNIDELVAVMGREIEHYAVMLSLAETYEKYYTDGGGDFFLEQAKEFRDIARLKKEFILSTYKLALLA